MNTWYVSPTGSDTTGDGSTGNPWQHIYKAIDESTSGDIILLKDGTYDAESARTISGKSLTIKSESDDYSKVTVNAIIAYTLWIINNCSVDVRSITFEVLSSGYIIIGVGVSGVIYTVKCFFHSITSEGAMYPAIALYDASTKGYFYKCTFRKFCKTSGNAALFYAFGSTEDIRDCIFEDNYYAVWDYPNTETKDYNCFYNNTYNTAWGTFVPQPHDLTSDPKFTGAGVATLEDDSPCIDAGVTIPGYVDETDPDIGAYESIGPEEIGESIITIVSSEEYTISIHKDGESEIVLVASEEHDTNPKEIGESEIVIVATEEHTTTPKETGESEIVITSSEEHNINPKETGESEVVMTSSEEHYSGELPLVLTSFNSDFRFIDANAVLTTFETDTDIRLKQYVKFPFSTDIRFKDSEYSKLEPAPITNFIIKLDGVTLTDVDLESTVINFNLGESPSMVTMTLGRRHDNFDYDLDGNYSQISNENKIEIYDNTRLLYTGYISRIDADSVSDVVNLTVQDVRYKISRLSPVELYYGYYYPADIEAIEADGHIIYSNNKTALKYVLDTLVSLNYLSSYDSTILDYINIESEGRNITDNYLRFIEGLIKECVTIDWYIDENEALQYVKRGAGDVKTLNLANLNSHRHLYDVIVSDVSLSRKQPEYVTGLLIKYGKNHIVNHWTDFTSETPVFYDYYINYKGKKTYFSFQDRNNILYYVGEKATNYSYYVPGVGYLIQAWFRYQIELINEYIEVDDEIIGSSDSLRTIQMDTYAIQQANDYYEERNEDDGIWLYLIQPANYDFRNYAKDLANLELNYANKLVTESTISLILDSYEYYNLSFKNRINLDNTIANGIFENNNEFPLNIQSITLTLKDRLVSMRLSNYGSTFFQRTVNYSSGIANQEDEIKLYKKTIVIVHGSGL